MRFTNVVIAASTALVLLGSGPVMAGEGGKKMEHRVEHAQGAVKDAWLDGKLEMALLFNEHLNSFEIETKVKNGTAYLHGAVESDIDRDLAGEIAKSIDGVTEVRNELVVDADKAQAERSESYRDRQGFKARVSNATLTARIKSQLLLNGNTGGMAIDVDSSDGIVTLSGEVDSEQEKDLALKIAENTSGARNVIDQLVIDTEDAE